jgi:hypothetical protein
MHIYINLSMLLVAAFFGELMPSCWNEKERGILLNTDDYRHENERCSTMVHNRLLVLYVLVSRYQGKVYCC